MKKNAQLAIVPKNFAPALSATPKVTKSEAIKAAVERARVKHEEKCEEHLAKVQLFEERLKAAALAYLIKEFRSGEVTEPTAQVVGDYGESIGNVEVTFSLPAGSFGALLREKKKLDAEGPGYFRADQVEKRLKDKLDTTQERIGLILKDEQNVRTIDALLASLNTK